MHHYIVLSLTDAYKSMNFKTALREANSLFVEDMYEDALDHYSTAIMLEGNHSDVYAKRAQCNIKLKNYKGRYHDIPS